MTRIRNVALDDLLACEPSDTSTGYEIREDWGTTYVSREGVEMFAQSARILEECRPSLEAWQEHQGRRRCIHGVRFDDESWGWSVNDYAFDLMAEPERAVIILHAWHDGEFCLPVWFDRSPGAFRWCGYVDEYWPEAER